MTILGPPTLADGDYRIDREPERHAMPQFPGEAPAWYMTRSAGWEGWLATSKPWRKSRRLKPFRLQTFIAGHRGRAFATRWERDEDAGLWVIRFQGMGPLTTVA